MLIQKVDKITSIIQNILNNKMDYFSLLPNELLLELSLYLNYRDMILACDILKCHNVNLWLNKIRKELGYSNEFIKEYVYDNGITKTLLPINEKYLELKARKSADFGCEFYKDIDILIIWASRIKDFQLANELVHYLLKLAKFIDPNFSSLPDKAVTGAVAVGNFQLTQDLIKEHESYDFDIMVIHGVYEAYPKGNNKILKYFNVKSPVYERDIIEGLINGGHLEELKKYDTRPDQFQFANAVKLGRSELVKYYDPQRYMFFISALVNSGRLELLSGLKLIQEETSLLIRHLIAHGYLEEVRKYEHSLIKYAIKSGYYVIDNCIIYNHIDMLDYLNTIFPIKIKSRVEQVFTDIIPIGNVLDITFKYLYENNLITQKALQNIDSETYEKMKIYNPDAYNYINSIINLS